MNTQFPVTNNLIHLNHAAVGPWPQVTSDAVKKFAEENLQVGSKHYLAWMETEKNLRKNLAQLINATSEDEIALVKNTSEGLSFVAYGLPWKQGENVVGIQQEFPSNRFVWNSLSSKGVEFRQFDLENSPDPEQGLFDLCDENTRLIAVSAVQYHNGFRMDLNKIGQFCKDRNILFCVDAIQQIGALPFDVQAIQADFVIADGHKWLLSAEGLGLFYVRKGVMDKLDILQYGWHMVGKLSDYSVQQFELAQSAKRFECGSPNMLGIHAMNASVELLLDVGMSKIGERVIKRSKLLIEQLEPIKHIEILSESTEQRLSGIITFRSHKIANDELYQYLSKEQVLCAQRGGGIRLSPHFYTPLEQLEKVISRIKCF
ncbi:MAG: aminotransferase class V-fold PLP-dependent enzyme [Gammaproteobacteria bacterium]|nr:aminotransferase class V-fold PLP-dependent enzyme [Gammaproteobacteria bacterium]